MQKSALRQSDESRSYFPLPGIERTGHAHTLLHDRGMGKEAKTLSVFSETAEGRDAHFRIGSQRGQASVIYGPGSQPLFYTALLQQPKRLAWSPIQNTITCRVTLCEVGKELQSGAEWSSLAGNQDGYNWPVPDLTLRSGCLYQWIVKPQSALALALPYPTAGKPDPTVEREARFWLLPTGTLEQVQDGLQLLRERSDPQFLPLAEAMFLAEYQLYQHALKRLPLFDAARNQAHTMLYETARSVIFRQMIQHMQQQPDLPTCFVEWATRNEQYHRRLTQESLPGQHQAARERNEQQAVASHRILI